jgi:hypothetical protein
MVVHNVAVQPSATLTAPVISGARARLLHKTPVAVASASAKDAVYADAPVHFESRHSAPNVSPLRAQGSQVTAAFSMLLFPLTALLSAAAWYLLKPKRYDAEPVWTVMTTSGEKDVKSEVMADVEAQANSEADAAKLRQLQMELEILRRLDAGAMDQLQKEVDTHTKRIEAWMGVGDGDDTAPTSVAAAVPLPPPTAPTSAPTAVPPSGPVVSPEEVAEFEEKIAEADAQFKEADATYVELQSQLQETNKLLEMLGEDDGKKKKKDRRGLLLALGGAVALQFALGGKKRPN